MIEQGAGEVTWDTKEGGSLKSRSIHTDRRLDREEGLLSGWH